MKLKDLLSTLLKSELIGNVSVVDNSNQPVNPGSFLLSGVDYIRNSYNMGFGAAHNLAMKSSIHQGIKYHLVLNPDITIIDDVIEKLYMFMDHNPDVGSVMPKVCYPDGSNQYLAKLLPTPDWLLVRLLHNLLPSRIVNEINQNYELRDLSLDQPVQVPSLSGCFMFLRCDALKKAGLFDERFFLYFEDFDLIRRIQYHYNVVYYPHCSIYHDFKRASRGNLQAFIAHVLSSVKYFNKWGWIKDHQREELNKRVLSYIQEKNSSLKNIN